jgi:hypothetical protein
MARSKFIYFALYVFVAASVLAAESGFYGLTRVRRILVNGVLNAEYTMEGFAHLTGYDELLVRKPGGTSVFLTGTNGVYGFVRYYGSDGGIDSSWPSDNYYFTFQDNSVRPTRIDSAGLFLHSGGSYADPLIVSNLTDTSTIDPSKSFTFRWANPGIYPANYLHFRIEKAGTILFQTEPDPKSPAVLSGSANSVVLPAGILEEGTKYDWFLSAVRIYTVNEIDMPNAYGFYGYKTQVQSSFLTRWQLMDAEYYFLGAAGHYTQTSASAPELQPDGSAYELFAHVGGTTNGGLVGATIHTPNSLQYILTNQGGSLHFSKFFPILEWLAGAPGGGGYQLKIQTTHNVQASADLAIYGPNVSPPQISNFAETQAIDPLSSFALRWSIDGGTTNHFVAVRVLDGDVLVAASPAFRFAANALSGTSNLFSIPAGRLQFGKTYELEISAFNSSWTNYTAYPGVVGESGWATVTHAQIKTMADPGMNLGIRRRGGQFEVFWPTNRVGFSLQRASDLNSQDGWKTLLSGAVAIENNWTAQVDTNSGPAFYRLIKAQ